MTQDASPQSPPPEETAPRRTPEQHAAVRRRALPVAFAAAVLAFVGILLLWQTPVSAFMPPNLLGINLAMCAILMGAGILFYARHTAGTRAAAILSLTGIVLGLAGTLVYTRQAVASRQAREDLERTNVQAVAQAAAAYAAQHQGAYPADLLVLLESKLLKPEALQSPYGQHSPLFDAFDKAQTAAASRTELLKSVETASDYLYLGAALKSVPPDLAPDILVAASTNTILRESYAVAFADGKARFITLDDVPGVMEACNRARAKMGLGNLKPPAIMQSALQNP